MNARDTTTVLSALRRAKVLLVADRQTHFDSNVTKSGQLPVAEQPLLRAYDTALLRIERSIAILDPASAAISNMLATSMQVPAKKARK
jgi:hypothetical protein